MNVHIQTCLSRIHTDTFRRHACAKLNNQRCDVRNARSMPLTLILLSTQGMAVVFAPLRGETLRLFCQLAQQAGLCASQHQQYDAQVWDVHLKVRT